MRGRITLYFCLLAFVDQGWADFENISASKAKEIIIHSEKPNFKTALSYMALGLERLSIRDIEDFFHNASIEQKAKLLRLQALANYRIRNYQKCLESLDQVGLFEAPRIQDKILRAYCLMRAKKYKDCIEYLENQDESFFSSHEVFSVWLTCIKKTPQKDSLKKRLPSLSSKYRLLALISLAQEALLSKNKQELADLSEQIRSLLTDYDQLSEFDQFLIKLLIRDVDIQLPEFYEKAFEIIKVSERYAQ